MRDATARGAASRRLTEARTRVTDTAALVYERRLTCAAGGNISARVGDRVVITPSGRSFRDLDRGDLAVLDLAGGHLEGPPPSSERLLHLAIYRRRPDVAFILHAHAPYSIAASCLPRRADGTTMPAYTGGYAIMIGRLPIVPHYVPSTPALAEAASEALVEANAALLANHGTVAVGRDPELPFQLTELIEENALVHVHVGGLARALDDEEIDECRRLYKKPPAPRF